MPFVVSGPGVARGRTESFMNTTDLFATIAGYAGARSKPRTPMTSVQSCRGGMAAVTMFTLSISRIDARDAEAVAMFSVGR